MKESIERFLQGLQGRLGIARPGGTKSGPISETTSSKPSETISPLQSRQPIDPNYYDWFPGLTPKQKETLLKIAEESLVERSREERK